jgi:hypothetical protein
MTENHRIPPSMITAEVLMNSKDVTNSDITNNAPVNHDTNKNTIYET